MKRNNLSRADARRLEDWLLMQWDRVDKTCKSFADVAKLAVADLHYTVSEGNVKGACEVIGKRPSFLRRENTGGLMKMTALNAMIVIDLYRLLEALQTQPVDPDSAAAAVQVATRIFASTAPHGDACGNGSPEPTVAPGAPATTVRLSNGMKVG